VKELSDSVRGTNRALDSAIARLDSLDDVIERGRADIRESVGKTAEHWPFPIWRPQHTMSVWTDLREAVRQMPRSSVLDGLQVTTP
jgi:hypothetical protein